jgi:hypothetical protein
MIGKARQRDVSDLRGDGHIDLLASEEGEELVGHIGVAEEGDG